MNNIKYTYKYIFDEDGNPLIKMVTEEEYIEKIRQSERLKQILIDSCVRNSDRLDKSIKPSKV